MQVVSQASLKSMVGDGLLISQKIIMILEVTWIEMQ